MMTKRLFWSATSCCDLPGRDARRNPSASMFCADGTRRQTFSDWRQVDRFADLPARRYESRRRVKSRHRTLEAEGPLSVSPDHKLTVRYRPTADSRSPARRTAALRRMSAIEVSMVISRKQTFDSRGMVSPNRMFVQLTRNGSSARSLAVPLTKAMAGSHQSKPPLQTA